MAVVPYLSIRIHHTVLVADTGRRMGAKPAPRTAEVGREDAMRPVVEATGGVTSPAFGEARTLDATEVEAGANVNTLAVGVVVAWAGEMVAVVVEVDVGVVAEDNRLAWAEADSGRSGAKALGFGVGLLDAGPGRGIDKPASGGTANAAVMEADDEVDGVCDGAAEVGRDTTADDNPETDSDGATELLGADEVERAERDLPEAGVGRDSDACITTAIAAGVEEDGVVVLVPEVREAAAETTRARPRLDAVALVTTRAGAALTAVVLLVVVVIVLLVVAEVVEVVAEAGCTAVTSAAAAAAAFATPPGLLDGGGLLREAPEWGGGGSCGCVDVGRHALVEHPSALNTRG